MASYVIVTNFHRSEMGLFLESRWNDEIAAGNSNLTRDSDGDMMYVVQYFNAGHWDKAKMLYDSWINENIWSELCHLI